MKATNGEVWQAQQALGQLCKEPWPVKTSYWLAKLSSKVRAQYAVVEQVRNELILRYGEKNEQGLPSINNKNEHWEEFLKDLNELMAEECDIDQEPVTLPDNDIRITPDVLIALEKFICLAQ